MKRWQSLLIGLVVSVGALYLAVRGADVQRVGEALKEARYEYALATVAIVAASTYVRGMRWSTLLEGKISATRGFWLFNTGFLFNNVLPLRLGEIVRAYLAARKPPPRFAGALSSIVLERLIDVLNLVLLLAIALQIPELDVPDWAKQGGLLMLAGGILGLVALYLLARYPEWATQFADRILSRVKLPARLDQARLLDQLEAFLEGLQGLRELRIFVPAVGYSLLAWAMSLAGAWVLLHSFAAFGTPGPGLGVLAITAAGLGIAVPSLPGGVGPFEAAITLALVAAGYEHEAALSYAVLLHAINYATTTVLGALGLLREGMSFGQVASAARQLGKSHDPDAEIEPVTPA